MVKITSLLPPATPLAFITEALIWVSCTAFVSTSLEAMEPFWAKYTHVIAPTLAISVLLGYVITVLICRYLGKVKWLLLAVITWRLSLITVGFFLPLLGGDAHG